MLMRLEPPTHQSSSPSKQIDTGPIASGTGVCTWLIGYQRRIAMRSGLRISVWLSAIRSSRACLTCVGVGSGHAPGLAGVYSTALAGVSSTGVGAPPESVTGFTIESAVAVSIGCCGPPGSFAPFSVTPPANGKLKSVTPMWLSFVPMFGDQLQTSGPSLPPPEAARSVGRLSPVLIELRVTVPPLMKLVPSSDMLMPFCVYPSKPKQFCIATWLIALNAVKVG